MNFAWKIVSAAEILASQSGVAWDLQLNLLLSASRCTKSSGCTEFYKKQFLQAFPPQYLEMQESQLVRGVRVTSVQGFCGGSKQ